MHLRNKKSFLSCIYYIYHVFWRECFTVC